MWWYSRNFIKILQICLFRDNQTKFSEHMRIVMSCARFTPYNNVDKYDQTVKETAMYLFAPVFDLIKGEGTPRKQATATQPQFPRTVISLS
jgi:hypothetical protein